MNRRRARGGKGRAGQWAHGAIALLRAIVAIGMAVLVMVGAVRGWDWLHHSERFTVTNIVFSGLHRTSEEELLRRSGLRKGENIFQANTAGAAAAMEQAEWVAHAQVARSLPDTIQVFIEERTPAAIVSAGPLFVVDGDGFRIKGLGASDRLDLPVISGVSADDFGSEDHPAAKDGLAAMEILRAFQGHRVSRIAALSELHVSVEGGETVFAAWCGDDPSVEARLGAFASTSVDDVRPVLDRLDRVLAELQHEGRRARFLDLGNRQRPDWVPAKLEAPQVASRLDKAH